MLKKKLNSTKECQKEGKGQKIGEKDRREIEKWQN